MKKIIAVMLSVSVLLFACGCEKYKSKTEIISKNISFNALVNQNGNDFVYTVKIGADGETEITWSSADNTEFLALFKDNSVTLSHLSVEDTFELSALPKYLTFDFFYQVFLNLKEQNPTIETKDDSIIATGQTEKYNFTVYLGETGLPLKITEQNYGITAIINDVKIEEK